LWEKTALDFAGDFEFLGGAAIEFEFGGVGAALSFEGVGNFVEADEGEGVAVGIAEARRDAAPDGRLFAEERRFGGDRVAHLASFGIKLDAAKARSVLKADAEFGPFLIFGEDVFGDECQASGTADEFEVERIGIGGDEGEDGLAVGRGNGDEAFTGLQFGVVGEVEAELVDVEAEAAVLVADVDIDGVDAEVGRWLRRWCGGAHGGDYTAGSGREEKDNAEAQSARSRAEEEKAESSLDLDDTANVWSFSPNRPNQRGTRPGCSRGVAIFSTSSSNSDSSLVSLSCSVRNCSSASVSIDWRCWARFVEASRSDLARLSAASAIAVFSPLLGASS